MARRVVKRKTLRLLSSGELENPYGRTYSQWFNYGLYNPRGKTYAIGIDQSLNHFGMAAVAEDGTAFLWKCESRKTGIQRLIDVRTFLKYSLMNCKMTTGGKPAHVVMEGPSYGTTNNAHGGGEIAAVVKLELIHVFGYADKVAYPTIIAAKSAKKFVTGNGGASKDEVIDAVRDEWKLSLDDDNLADAFGMAKIAFSLYSGVTNHKYQQEVIDNLKGRHTEWIPPKEPPKTSKTTSPSTKSKTQKKVSSVSRGRVTRKRLRRR